MAAMRSLTYRVVLQQYRPHELEAFNRKYVEEWRAAFRNVREVRYTDE